MTLQDIKSNQSLEEDFDTLIKIGRYDLAQNIHDTRISFLKAIY